MLNKDCLQTSIKVLIKKKKNSKTTCTLNYYYAQLGIL